MEKRTDGNELSNSSSSEDSVAEPTAQVKKRSRLSRATMRKFSARTRLLCLVRHDTFSVFPPNSSSDFRHRYLTCIGRTSTQTSFKQKTAGFTARLLEGRRSVLVAPAPRCVGAAAYRCALSLSHGREDCTLYRCITGRTDHPRRGSVEDASRSKATGTLFTRNGAILFFTEFYQKQHTKPVPVVEACGHFKCFHDGRLPACRA